VDAGRSSVASEPLAGSELPPIRVGAAAAEHLKLHALRSAV
jgi:hypothetical protein